MVDFWNNFPSGSLLLAAISPVQLGALCILAIGMLVLGMKDVARLSVRRLWAVSSVCFQESIRRRVLWITPLGILGVIVVAQMQRPLDEQDAVRQIIKYCLFTSGLLVVLTTIMTACTSLPKEIDTRVIYTIVTKPVTRLEIVAGKALGFARLSGAILLIMGIFTLVYVEFRAAQLRELAGQRYEHLDVNRAIKSTLQHYHAEGLLQSKVYEQAKSLQVAASEPDSSGRWWIFGNEEQDALFGFDIPAEAMPEITDPSADRSQSGFVVYPNVAAQQFAMIRNDWRINPQVAGADGWRPTPMLPRPPRPPHPATDGLLLPGEKLWQAVLPPPPRFAVQVLDEHRYMLVLDRSIQHPVFEVPVPQGAAAFIPEIQLDSLRPFPAEGSRRIYIQVRGLTASTLFGVNEKSIEVYSTRLGKMLPHAKDHGGNLVTCRGVGGIHGQQLRGGDAEHRVPTAVYHFEVETASIQAAGQTVPIEMRVGVERAGVEARTDEEDVTEVSLRVRNSASGKISEPQVVALESNRLAFASLPSQLMDGGKFDILVQCMTNGHYLGVRPVGSITMVVARQSFAWNLFKSLLVLWLMAMLVIGVALFSSTFLSWPVAVVLTMLLLLGRWGVVQLGESVKPGIGATIANDLFRHADPASKKVVSGAVEALTSALNNVAQVLPDISAYANEQIERCWAVPGQILADASLMTLGFAAPMLVAAYLLLKMKEVAP